MIKADGERRLRHTFDAADQGHTDYNKTGNLLAVQFMLEHTKVDSTVRYHGVELEDALAIA